MKTRVIVGVAAALVVALNLVAAHAQAPPKLEGTWVVAAAESDGKHADDLKGHRLTFEGNAFRIEREGQVLFKGTFKTDATVKPAHIDFDHTEGELAGKRWLGIYALRGDTLRIADNAPALTAPRPARLAAKAGSGHVLLRFKRATP